MMLGENLDTAYLCFFMSTYNVPISNLRLGDTGKTNGNLKQIITGKPLGINLVARRSACIGLGLGIGA